jgi:hypothetical protein
MRRLLALSIFLTASFFPAALLAGNSGQPSPDQGNLELTLIPGAPLRLELSAGDYRIEAGESDRMLITSRPKNPADRAKVHFGISATRTSALVRVNGSRDFAATIQIPRSLNLNVRLSAGRLVIDRIIGDTDIQSHAGELEINVGRPEEYKTVNASVLAGDIDASAFQGSKSGLFRSFNSKGPGKYHLHVHLGAGQIRLIRQEEI